MVRPQITAEALRTVNKWDKARLVAFLRKGAGNNTTVLGPMQEVVHDSLSFLTESDLDAMATFLLDLPPGAETPPKPVAKKLAPDVEARATKLYSDNCASCHQADGKGIANQIPPLAGNPAILAAKPFDILAAVLQGVPARDDIIAMPSFAGSLGDQSVADLANYVRTGFGNEASPNATPSMVAAWRSTLSLPVYASASARTFDCPSVGQGGSASFDPSVIAGLGRELSQRSVSYAQLVADYQAKTRSRADRYRQQPDRGLLPGGRCQCVVVERRQEPGAGPVRARDHILCHQHEHHRDRARRRDRMGNAVRRIAARARPDVAAHPEMSSSRQVWRARFPT
jgi:Cytochrome c, mono- and diheme variants